MQRLQSAPAVAAQGRIPVAQADAAEWLAERSDAHAHEQDAAPVVWHSIVRTYVDPAQRSNVEEPRVLARVWRLAYEPDPTQNRCGIPLRLHGPGTGSAGDIAPYGTGHGPRSFSHGRRS